MRLKNRENKDYDFPLGARELTVAGFLDALGKSPIIDNFPPAFKKGELIGGNKVISNTGKTVPIERDEDTPIWDGTKVVVYERAELSSEKTE